MGKSKLDNYPPPFSHLLKYRLDLIPLKPVKDLNLQVKVFLKRYRNVLEK